MPGLNHVTRGGEPLTVDLSSTVTMTKVSVGEKDNNAYLLRTTGAALLVDAADDPETLMGLIEVPLLRTVVTTHRHADHWQALRSVARTRARLVAGRPDAVAIGVGAQVPEPDGVWDGDVLLLGDESLTVIGVVGHTPGSVTLAYAPAEGPVHLFTGDSLFPGGPGKTWSAADFTTLMDDLEAKVFGVYADDTVVHPGHGDDTTLGAERPHLAEWRARGW